ncbi:MAG: hypothetical protein QF662_06630 [Phycisphaerae bacterium]|nr:hypothetical protein [Phycisphaerae bacterium]
MRTSVSIIVPIDTGAGCLELCPWMTGKLMERQSGVWYNREVTERLGLLFGGATTG